jgi:FlaA1/EpsC-like NDP-sugar epimerase
MCISDALLGTDFLEYETGELDEVRVSRIVGFILADLVLSLAAIGLAIFIRFEGEIPSRFLSGQEIYFFTMALACVIVFFFSGLYEKVWRYAGMHELLTIVGAVSISLAPYFIYSLATGGTIFPRGIIIIAWFTNIFFLGGIRFILRLVSQEMVFHRGHPRTRVLIVGANDIGEMVLREIQRAQPPHYAPIGFIDDDPGRQNVVIHGIPVLGNKENLPAIIEKRGIDELIIALPSPTLVRTIVSLCENLKVGLKIIPSLSEIISGSVAVSQIREVQIEDLLDRAPVRFDIETVALYIKDRIILVSGAGGSIGSEICRQIIRLCPKELILLGHGENSIYEIYVELSSYSSVPLRTFIGDIRDEDRMNLLFSGFRPDVVFHAAAHKHVPLMETNSIEAVTNNIFGTRVLSEMSDKYGAERFIFLSTDKAVNPVSVMGTTKRIAEAIISSWAKTSKTCFVTVRFGNVLGSRGSVVPTFKHQIKMGGPITITDETMTRFFMTIPEAVQLVVRAGAMASRGRIFILDMGKPIRILDLARNIIRLSGLEVGTDIKIEIKGIRPGEKLEEELVNYGEDVEKTEVEKIIRVKSCETEKEKLDLFLRELKEAVEAQDEARTRKMILESAYLFPRKECQGSQLSGHQPE